MKSPKDALAFSPGVSVGPSTTSVPSRNDANYCGTSERGSLRESPPFVRPRERRRKTHAHLQPAKRDREKKSSARGGGGGGGEGGGGGGKPERYGEEGREEATVSGLPERSFAPWPLSSCARREHSASRFSSVLFERRGSAIAWFLNPSPMHNAM